MCIFKCVWEDTDQLRKLGSTRPDRYWIDPEICTDRGVFPLDLHVSVPISGTMLDRNGRLPNRSVLIRHIFPMESPGTDILL